MKILENKVTDYTSTNLTENETTWTSDATFNYEDEIRDGHFIYKYAGENGTNTTDAPSIDCQKQVQKWVKIRPTNYYAMLDAQTQTQTENNDSIIVEFDYINFDSLSLIDLVAQEVVVTLTDDISSDIIYTKTVSLVDNSSIIDFTTYCFNEMIRAGSLYLDDITLYSNATLKVEIKQPNGIAKCGRLVCGRSNFIGSTGYGANLDIESYSRISTDIFGNTTLIHSQSVNLDSYEVYVQTEAIPNIRRRIRELDAVPILFIMDESQDSKLENLLTYGYFENFSILIPNSKISTASITIKGII